MKKIYEILISNCCFAIVLLLGSMLISSNTKAQDNTGFIYSNFTVPDGKYAFDGPACATDEVKDLSAIADADLTNYASLSTPQSCSNKPYSFRSKLNLPKGMDCAPDAYAAGFKISMSSKLNLSIYGSNIRLNTYYKGVWSETNATKQLIGLEVLESTGESLISFVPKKRFDEVEIVFNDAPISYTIGFKVKVWYAFTASLFVLPATVTDFKVLPAGNNAAISWKSLTETNVGHYDVQRSSDGIHFTTVTSIKPAINNGNSASYSYTDHLATGGTYFYRISIVNKDGSAVSTDYVNITFNGNNKMLIYPTVLKAGQPLYVKTATAGAFTIAVYDVQGRVLKQERKTSDGITTINTAGLAAGTYAVKVTTESGSILQSKFIIN